MFHNMCVLLDNRAAHLLVEGVLCKKTGSGGAGIQEALLRHTYMHGAVGGDGNVTPDVAFMKRAGQ